MKPDDVDRLFSKLEPVNPPKNLVDEIVTKIEDETQRSLMRRVSLKIALMISGIIVVCPLFVWAMYWLIEDLRIAGTWNFLSMLGTDFGAALGNVYDLLLAILESLPIASIVMVLASALLIFVLLEKALSSWSQRKNLQFDRKLNLKF